MHPPKPVGVDAATGENLYLLSDLFPAKEEPMRPPGYYVETSDQDARCGHCGGPFDGHIPQPYHLAVPNNWAMCPRQPLFIREAMRLVTVEWPQR